MNKSTMYIFLVIAVYFMTAILTIQVSRADEKGRSPVIEGGHSLTASLTSPVLAPLTVAFPRSEVVALTGGDER